MEQATDCMEYVVKYGNTMPADMQQNNGKKRKHFFIT